MAYSMFNDVLIFDFTYKTNKFRMSLLHLLALIIVAICFGGALLEDEPMDTFIWLFKQFHHRIFDRAPIPSFRAKMQP